VHHLRAGPRWSHKRGQDGAGQPQRRLLVRLRGPQAGSGRLTASSRWAGRRVALLTAATVPDLKRDEVLLARAFESAGATVETAIWSEPFRGADLTVIRSCWDYADRPAEFLAALDVIAGQSELWNPTA